MKMFAKTGSTTSSGYCSSPQASDESFDGDKVWHFLEIWSYISSYLICHWPSLVLCVPVYFCQNFYRCGSSTLFWRLFDRACDKSAWLLLYLEVIHIYIYIYLFFMFWNWKLLLLKKNSRPLCLLGQNYLKS